MKFINKFQKYMFGRYGIDELYKFLLYLYFFVMLINLFIKSNILSILELIIFIVMFYRIFSKKIYKRSNENVAFIKLRGKILKPYYIFKRNFRDRNICIYKRCKHCNKLLKLPIPNSRGKKIIKCPKCKKEFNVFILRKEKIEIISKSTKKG